MNIENLSDTELNRAMIWLYPPSGKFYQIEHEGDKFCPFLEQGIRYWHNYNYLSLWQITMPLAVDWGLITEFSLHGDHYAGSEDYGSFSTNPLRAICEVLVQIALTKA